MRIANDIYNTMNKVRNELSNSELEYVMRGQNWMNLMTYISDDIVMAAKQAGSESDIAFECNGYQLKISASMDPRMLGLLLKATQYD